MNADGPRRPPTLATMCDRTCSVSYGSCGHLMPSRQVEGSRSPLAPCITICPPSVVTRHPEDGSSRHQIHFHPYRTYRVDHACPDCGTKPCPPVRAVTPQVRRIVLEEQVWSYMLSRGMFDASRRHIFRRQDRDENTSSSGLIALQLGWTERMPAQGSSRG